MQTKDDKPVKEAWWRGRGRTAWVGLVVVVAVGVLTVVAARKMSTTDEATIKACDAVCELARRLDKAVSENIDLRAEKQRLKAELQEKDEKTVRNPPDSRHFYDCKPAKKKGMWNLALYSHTTNQLSAYECASWRGHTSPHNILSETERKKLTCTDPQRGVTLPWQ